MKIRIYFSVVFIAVVTFSLWAQQSFTNGSLNYTQNFDGLSNTGTTNTTLPTGWLFSETGTNANASYAADNGTITSGNTYSYGITGATERAFGELTSGSLVSTIGTSFINNTDSAIVKIRINFFAELWRKGALSLKDSAIFQYSTDATSLTNGTWTTFNKLSLITPNLGATVGPVDGNQAVNRLFIRDSVTGISVSPGSTIWIRWTGVNITGNDDGISIDDFNATAVKGAAVVIPSNISFIGSEKSILENAGATSIYLKINGPNNLPSSIEVQASVYSTATATQDYSLQSALVTFPGNSLNNDSLPITISILNDALPENTEYIIFTLTNGTNANPAGTNQYTLYIRDNDLATPSGNNELNLTLLGSFSNGVSGTNSAEIVAYDSTSKRLFIANSVGSKMDIVDFTNPSSPILISSISTTPYGNINSVAAKNGIIAVAIENSTNPQDSGKVVFFNSNGTFLNSVKVGMMPDMITFNNAGTKVLTANEGEPNAAYTNDPDGSISVINISGGVAGLNQSNVGHIVFTGYNGSEAVLKSLGIRIYGLNATASKDFEPEYITVSDDDTKAWVTLQENNAIAEINLLNNSIVKLIPLGYKNHMLFDNAMDVSDVTSQVNIANWPVKGMYLPDAVAQYSSGNNIYLLTANEGDARAYTGFNEEARVSTLNLDATKFPNAGLLKNNLTLGKLNATNKWGDTDNDGDIDSIFVYGSRSFSIWNPSNNSRVYDSGSELERITANHPTFSNMFNASNGSTIVKKNRSDDKGPEPEGIATAKINGQDYAFIALERIGGMMIYNITNPSAPYYVNYVNNRPPDLGAEGIIYIPASASPNGKAIVVLANEVSSTLTFYQVESCVSTLNLSLNTSGNTGFCPGDSLLLQNTGNLNANYQWVKNGINVSGATSPSIQTSSPGSYMLIIDKGVGCKDTTSIVNVSAYPAPNAIITPTGTQEICQGDSLTISVSLANTYLWSELQTSQTIVVTNAGNYAVTVIDSNGCSKSSDTVVVNVNALPTVSVTSSGPSVICQGDSVVFTSSSASSYLWSNGATTQNISASLSGNYFVTVTDTNGCSKTSGVQNLNVNTLPVANISAGGPAIFCQGDSVTLLSSAAASYLWSNGATTQQITVSTAGNYSVTITDNNGCSNTSAVQNVIVNSLPLVTANSATVCLGDTIVLSASGATTYIWNTGATTAAITVTGTSPQVIYSVTGTDNNGCSAAVTNTLTTNPLPNVSAVSSAPGDSICSGNTITLNGAGASNYAWSGGIVNGVAFSPSASLTYTVTGTDVNGCSNTYALGVTVNACLGLDVENILFLVNVFPNPANDILNMTFSGSREDLKFELMNGIGQVLITEKSESVNSVNENTIQMNVNELSNGVYFLNVSDNNSNVKTIRVVINK
ncbi:MAG: choice-of-anchor I family protein [Bacteroidota bacterium]